MKFFKWPIFIIFFLALISFGLQASENKSKADSTKTEKPKKQETDKSKIDWPTYPEGLTKIKTEKKHIFIDFTASWCGWCKRMEREAFSDPTVIEKINDHFIPGKVWGDSNDMLDIDGYKITQRNLSHAQFGVRGFPTFWFISPEGVRIGPLPGYQTTDRLIEALDWVKEYKYDTTRVENKSQPDKSGE